MSTRDRLKAAIRTPVRAVGYDIVKFDPSPPPVAPPPVAPPPVAPTWADRLNHARQLGLVPSVIIDGGGYHGEWTIEAATIFPGAQLVVIEPNPFVRDIIHARVAAIRPEPIIIEVALGEAVGRTRLNMWKDRDADPSASVHSHVRGGPAADVDVAVDTLDAICSRLGLRPDLVKLDLQGHESAAIKGATAALRHAEALLVEFGCLEAYIGRTTPRELMEAAYAAGYVLYDIVDLLYRPYDGAMLGGDFLFVRQDSGLRSYKGPE